MKAPGKVPRTKLVYKVHYGLNVPVSLIIVYDFL